MNPPQHPTVNAPSLRLTPKVSVITPCYNAEKYIGRTIESVRAQTFPDWEHIVVDDGSTDGSADIVASYVASDPRLRLIRQPNGGVCNARNNGFAACSAHSTYLWFLDADDCLEPNALEIMTTHLDMHRDVGLAYCSSRPIDGNDQLLESDEGDNFEVRYAPTRFGVREIAVNQPETPFASLVAYFRAVPSKCCMRRSVFERTGGWDETVGQPGEDKDMVLQMALVAPVHFAPHKLVRYRRHETNATKLGIYAVLKRVHSKWWLGHGLTPQQRRMVREAILFDHRLWALFQFKGALANLRRRNFRQGVKRSLQGSKKIAAYFLGYIRWVADGLLGDFRLRSRDTPARAGDDSERCNEDNR